jgi:hypothetical protein
MEKEPDTAEGVGKDAFSLLVVRILKMLVHEIEV